MSTITFSIPTPLFWIVAASTLDFIVLTVLLWMNGVFDGSDLFGINLIFTLLTYFALWLIPSLAAWAIWATWFQ